MVLGTLAAAACSRNDPGDAPATSGSVRILLPGAERAPGDILATVNERPVTAAMLQQYSTSRSAQHPLGAKPSRQDVLEELINLEVLAQAAERRGIDRRPEVTSRILFERNNILGALMMKELVRESPITEDQVRREYEQRYQSTPRREYKTRNILVATEKQARRLIDRLRRGTDFAALAREYSKGPAAESGGALEWYKPEDVLAEYAEAVAELNQGEFTKTPVQTTYGWHVILLEDRREIPVPPLEQVEEKIYRRLASQRLDERLKQLRDQADIQVNATR